TSKAGSNRGELSEAFSFNCNRGEDPAFRCSTNARSVGSYPLLSNPCVLISIAAGCSQDLASTASSAAGRFLSPSIRIFVIESSPLAYSGHRMCESEECEARSGATAKRPLDSMRPTGQWFHHSKVERVSSPVYVLKEAGGGATWKGFQADFRFTT